MPYNYIDNNKGTNFVLFSLLEKQKSKKRVRERQIAKTLPSLFQNLKVRNNIKSNLFGHFHTYARIVPYIFPWGLN